VAAAAAAAAAAGQILNLHDGRYGWTKLSVLNKLLFGIRVGSEWDGITDETTNWYLSVKSLVRLANGMEVIVGQTSFEFPESSLPQMIIQPLNLFLFFPFFYAYTHSKVI
jgi:hypothetical protein